MSDGYSHVGVSTLDMDSTINFYEHILGFPKVLDNLTNVKEGGTLRQVYFDLGKGQYIVFMEPKGVKGIPNDFDTGINKALGLPGGMYHFAFKVESLHALEDKRIKLKEAGVVVSDIIDLDTAKSIFLTDPNQIQIELCCHMRSFTESDLFLKSEASIAT